MGLDRIFFTVFASGVKKFLNTRGTKQIFEPVSPIQLLFIIIAIFPGHLRTLGFLKGTRVRNFFNRMAHVAVLLCASLGFRIGEILPARPGTRIPFRARERKKILRISNIAFSSRQGDFVSLASFVTVKEQVRFLLDVMKNPRGEFGVIALDTKNGNNRCVGTGHHHLKNSNEQEEHSILMCPLCSVAVFLVHRLGCDRNSPLLTSDYLFVLLAKDREIPFPATTMRDTLFRVCKQLNFYPVHPHDLKRGILT